MIDLSSFYKNYFKPGNVFTDSRNVIQDGVFIALKGESFNGNKFASDAIKAGARIAVVDEAEFISSDNILLVEDTLKFLQHLGQFHRKATGVKIIAITGTNGKTTTKELIRSVLSEKYTCQATIGNLNNHIGVPLTLLSILPDTQIAIIEMGANHPGEIDQLCSIALPDYGIITNIGKAHLQGFGSFEGVIKTKSELYSYIKSTSGEIFYNASNPILSKLIDKYPNVIKYNTADSISANIISSTPSLKIEISIFKNNSFIVNSKLYGEYNFENILAAVCIGNQFSLNTDKICKGIEKYIPENNRSQILKKGTNLLILDCYNANPTSMQEAIISFGKTNYAKKVAILGGMKELGPYSEEEHTKLIKLLKENKFRDVLLVGEEFTKINFSGFQCFQNTDDLIGFLKINKFIDNQILIKGSRANKLERIVDFLT